jgi:hypothetical protein
MTSRRRFLAVAGATATGLGVAAYSRRGESLFMFGDGVPSTVRERCQRVEGRYPDLIDRMPTDPVRIEMESDRPSRSGFDSESRASRIRFSARHFTPADIDVPPAAGYYDDARGVSPPTQRDRPRSRRLADLRRGDGANMTNTLIIAPPLPISEDDIDEAVDSLDAALEVSDDAVEG